jgi:S-DNA-T family DNA segregation ATPase FtsK/SpoIIIE
MLLKLSVAADRTADPVDLAVPADRECTVADLRSALAELFDQPPDTAVCHEGRPLSDDMRMGGPGLRSGCLLTLGPPGGRTNTDTSVLQLRVLSGPDCGQLLPVRRGVQVIGRSPEPGIRIADPDLSRRHAELQADLHTVAIRDLGSTNGTLVDGVPVGADPVPVRLGCHISMGGSVLTVVGSSEPPAVVKSTDQADLLVYRPPRVVEPPVPESVHFPAPTTTDSRPRIHWLAAIVPAFASVLLAVVMRSPQFLAFALLSPLGVIASAVSDRRDWRRGARARRLAHAEAEQAALTRLDDLLGREIDRRHHRFPDAATIMQAVSVPDCRLWERRTADAEFLQLRLGLADQAAELTTVRDGVPGAAPQLHAVPATVSLASHPLGIAGPIDLVRASARWLVSQILALHSPTDVQVFALLDDAGEHWRWLRWPAAGVRRLATCPSEWQSGLDELSRLTNERLAQAASNGLRWAGQWIVVLIDPAVIAVELTGLRTLLEAGPAVGITVICVGEDLRVLPAGCHATACSAGDAGGRLVLTNPRQPPLSVTAEGVSIEWADRLARRLAPLRDADTEPSSRLPVQLGLAGLLGMQHISSSAIRQRWADRCGRPSTPVGVCASGPFELDLVQDGPHLLIAGTTGAGKSELLRTLVAGLAASNPPDELSFVLIDYKGGAAFAECAQLPHTLGLVTDLDGHLTRRALVSLDAELRRREAAFARAAVADLDSYRVTPEAGRYPLARLVLIIDEFASLAEELPDFLTGMLGIAQRGRSLGLHLLLATQRPAGAVSLDIKANMSLRIALRMADAAESGDVIDDGAASRIPRDRPGRALARLSAGDPVEFQTALVSLPVSDPVPLLTQLDRWNRLPTPATPAQPVSSELQLLSTAIRQAALSADLHQGRPPWLTPLPERLTVDRLEPDPTDPYLVAFGLTDDPARQRQEVAMLDLATGGSWGFIGGSRSGRSSALRTVIGQSVRRLTSEQLNLYVLDCAGRGFAAIRRLPHCGAVLERDDPATIARLISRLLTEVADRQRACAELGAGTLAEAIRLGARMPALLLAIDGWEGLSGLSEDHDAGSSVDGLLQLLRDGPAVGLTILITGDRAALGVRLGSAIGTKLILPLTERSDYAVAGINPSSLPGTLRPGLAISTEDGLHTQLALLKSDPSPLTQLRAIQRAALAQSDGAAEPAIVIRNLPERVELAEISAAQPVPIGHCLLGVGGDDASAVSCELLQRHSRFLITGPARCGRSNAVSLVARQAYSAGHPVLVAAPARSPLADWGRAHARWMLGPDDQVEPDGLSYSLHELEVIVIDDAEQFTDSKMGEFLLELVVRHPAAVIASARSDDLLVSFRGIGVELRRHRNGLLLHPTAADAELLGVRLGRQRTSHVAGRGLLVTDDVRRSSPAGLAIQLAL